LAPAWAVALAPRVIVFQPYTIPSSSMEPGLVTGDYIVVSKWPYGWSRASIPFNLPLPAGRRA
jgi:signal peptidase I